MAEQKKLVPIRISPANRDKLMRLKIDWHKKNLDQVLSELMEEYGGENKK